MSLESLARDYLKALDSEAEHEARRQRAVDDAVNAHAVAAALETEMLTLAQGGELFVLSDRLVSIDRGVVTIQAVKNLDLVQ